MTSIFLLCSTRVTAFVVAAFASFGAYAGPVVFGITGYGTSSAVSSNGVSTLTYSNMNVSGNWQVRGVADQAGDYSFRFDDSGFYSYFNVTAYLTTTAGDTLVNAGPANCCSPPSNGFSYMGDYTFTGLQAGESFGFNVGGSNSDSNRLIQGTLTLSQTSELSQVPEPGSLALVSLALVGLGAARRRIKS